MCLHFNWLNNSGVLAGSPVHALCSTEHASDFALLPHIVVLGMLTCLLVAVAVKYSAGRMSMSRSSRILRVSVTSSTEQMLGTYCDRVSGHSKD
jgi:hypothetical protein